QQSLFKDDNLIERDLNLEPYLKGNEIIIITGIRRCGKSSLLKIIARNFKTNFYLNFDDIRLTDFQADNFHDLYEIALEITKDKPIFFLDEVQNVKDWEKWVNNLHEKGYKVFLTGSNSNLLSSEISTFLTGRNKTIKLHTFSFKEFLRLKNITNNFDFNINNINNLTTEEKIIIKKNINEYLEIGGFPLIIKNNDLELSRNYFEDILNKDILNRYNIRQSKEIKDLSLYLFSNIGNIYSYSRLKEITGIKSLSTIKNFIDYLKNSYLLYTINRFDFSIAKQKISSSKVYASDISFLKTISFNFSQNLGKRLENLVFLNLIKKDSNTEVYYHLDKSECDFIVKKGLKITQAIQVSLNIDNKREIEGIKSAMKKYKLNEGIMVNLEIEKEIKEKDKTIKIMPIWKFLLQ
ncbi:MAG: ATP-binding protein, partial [Candidatus Woesearchaeota archaeon]